MNDVIEIGRPDRPRRNGVWLGAGAATLLVAGLAVTTLRPGTTAAKTSASPTPTVSVPPLETYEPTPDPTEPPPEPEPPIPTEEWETDGLAGPTGLSLAGPSDGLLVLDLDTGRTTSAGVGGDSLNAVQPVAAIAGGWLVLRSEDCGDPPCPEPEVYAVRRGRATLVAHGSVAKPDPDGRTVWVTGLHNPPADLDPDAATHWLERWTFGGTRVGPRTLMRPGEGLLGVTPSGPVIGTYISGSVTLVSATTRARTRLVRGGTGIAVAGNVVAWTSPGCEAREVKDCRAFLTDVRTARTRQVGRLRWSSYVASLDPTGRYLAVACAPYDQEVEAVVEVLDTKTGAVVALGGNLAQVPTAESLTWSPSGKWLVLTHGRTSGGDSGGEVFEGHTVALWRPGHRLMRGPDFPGAADRAFAVAG